jgi:hypothetical protein
VIVMVAVPILLSFPAMFLTVPPLVVRVPTMLPFGIQIAAAVLGLSAVLAVVVYRSIQPCFGFFNGVLALRSVIGVRQGRCSKPRKRCHYNRRYCCSSNSLSHGFSFS